MKVVARVLWFSFFALIASAMWMVIDRYGFSALGAVLLSLIVFGAALIVLTLLVTGKQLREAEAKRKEAGL